MILHVHLLQLFICIINVKGQVNTNLFCIYLILQMFSLIMSYFGFWEHIFVVM